jgi:hypothetical protein
MQYKLRKGLKEYNPEELPRVGRDGRKLQTNPTSKFLIEALRNHGFKQIEAGKYQFYFIKQRHFQVTTLLRLMDISVEELLLC